MHYVHGVRWAQLELTARQEEIEQRAERLRAA